MAVTEQVEHSEFRDDLFGHVRVDLEFSDASMAMSEQVEISTLEFRNSSRGCFRTGGEFRDGLHYAVQTHRMVVAITESAADGNRISKTPGHETT